MLLATAADARVVSKEAFTRAAGDNKVTKIRVVQNPSRKSDRNPARFFNAEGWGIVGEQLAKLEKGAIVTLFGELKLDKYPDKKTGQERIDDVLTVTHFRVQKSEQFFGRPALGTGTDSVADPEPSPGIDTDIPF